MLQGTEYTGTGTTDVSHRFLIMWYGDVWRCMEMYGDVCRCMEMYGVDLRSTQSPLEPETVNFVKSL